MKDTADKQCHWALWCHKLVEYVVCVDVLGVADGEDVDYVTVDVVEDEIDDVESDYETASARHGEEYDDEKSREPVDVLELIVDDAVNDAVGNEVVVLVAHVLVAVINYFKN